MWKRPFFSSNIFMGDFIVKQRGEKASVQNNSAMKQGVISHKADSLVYINPRTTLCTILI